MFGLYDFSVNDSLPASRFHRLKEDLAVSLFDLCQYSSPQRF